MEQWITMVEVEEARSDSGFVYKGELTDFLKDWVQGKEVVKGDCKVFCLIIRQADILLAKMALLLQVTGRDELGLAHKGLPQGKEEEPVKEEESGRTQELRRASLSREWDQLLKCHWSVTYDGNWK